MKMILVHLLCMQLAGMMSCTDETSGAHLDREENAESSPVFPSDATLVTLAELRQVNDSSTTKKYYTIDEGKYGYWYYDANDKSSKDNEGTIVVTSSGQRFKRVYTDTVNVNWFGAMGNDEECTRSFQAAVDAGKIIYVPDGTYLIEVGNHTRYQSIWLKSGQTLLLSKKANIRAKPNGLERYYLVKILGASNVIIDGGNFIGDKQEHSGTSGESGHLIGILNSKDVEVRNTTIKNAWGDGIYIGSDIDDQQSERVTIDGVTVDNSRRNGLSVVAGKFITIANSTFSNTTGTEPEAGIDIEPNEGMVAEDITIRNVKVYNNAGAGIMTTEHADRVSADKITASGNLYGVRLSSTGYNYFVNLDVYQNKKSGVYLNYAGNSLVSYSKSYKNGEHGFYLLNCSNTHKFVQCEAWENDDGFAGSGETAHITIDSCIARDNRQYGFNIDQANTVLRASQAYRNGKAGVLLTDNVTATGNEIFENGEQGLRIYGSNGIYQNNKIHSNAQADPSKDNIEVKPGALNNKIAGGEGDRK